MTPNCGDLASVRNSFMYILCDHASKLGPKDLYATTVDADVMRSS